MAVLRTILWCGVCLLALDGAGRGVAAIRLKIQLDPEFPTRYARHLLGCNDPCSDVVAVQPSDVTLYGNLQDLGPDVKFWRSAIAREHLAVFEGMKVPGLGGKTVGDVFVQLREWDCFPYFLGGSVRDQFLNRVPNDADVEVDCSMEKFGKLCVETWGKDLCHYKPGRPIAHIGNTTISDADKDLEVMDVGSTNSTFYVPIYKLEYTVNDMAYDTNGNDIIIDLTGTGPWDACAKHIRIPSNDNSVESWEQWMISTQGVLLRFWKLRTKGLTAFNADTQVFVVEGAKREIQENPTSFPLFYCYYVFNSWYNIKKKKCNIPPEQCEKGMKSALLYNKVMAEDLGDFWPNVVLPKYMPSLEDCNTKTISLNDQ